MTLEEQVNELLDRIEKVEMGAKDGWDKTQIFFGIIAGLVMPIVVAVTGYYLNQAINQSAIQEKKEFSDLQFEQTERLNQLEFDQGKQLKELDEQFAERQRDRVERGEGLDREIRYLELIYKDLYSEHVDRRNLAIDLVSALDPELQEKIGKILKATAKDDKEKAQAEEIVASASTIISINNSVSSSLSKIGIYYDLEREDQRVAAEKIAAYFGELGIKQTIQLNGRERASLTDVRFHPGIQVRYDAFDSVEHDAADSISAVLRERFGSYNIETCAVNRSGPATKGFLSVFLVADEHGGFSPAAAGEARNQRNGTENNTGSVTAAE